MLVYSVEKESAKRVQYLVRQHSISYLTVLFCRCLRMQCVDVVKMHYCCTAFNCFKGPVKSFSQKRSRGLVAVGMRETPARENLLL